MSLDAAKLAGLCEAGSGHLHALGETLDSSVVSEGDFFGREELHGDHDWNVIAYSDVIV